jgi:hypothetical protein
MADAMSSAQCHSERRRISIIHLDTEIGEESAAESSSPRENHRASANSVASSVSVSLPHRS